MRQTSDSDVTVLILKGYSQLVFLPWCYVRHQLLGYLLATTRFKFILLAINGDKKACHLAGADRGVMQVKTLSGYLIDTFHRARLVWRNLQRLGSTTYDV